MLRKPRCLVGVLVLCLTATGALAAAGGTPVTVTVLHDQPNHIVIQYALGDFTREAVDIGGEKFTRIALGKESPIMQAGAPELPNVCRSLIIPDDARMTVRVLGTDFYEIDGLLVAPSKGHLPRTINPADVPYTFGKTYDTNEFFPGELVSLRDPYILRDYRGVVVELNPFQYDPVTRTLRVYTAATVAVATAGPGQLNVLDRSTRSGNLSLAFHQLYRRHFLNYGAKSRYNPLDEVGEILIICHDAWLTNVQPLANHKIARGISTTVVGVSTIGNSAALIKSYIQNLYDTSDLAFVLLVGDAAQVDTPYASGGSADPTYAKVAGTDDYPDIMIGRFSAETTAHVDTQVERTIEYENMSAWSQDWFWRGTGVASNQGPGDGGEYDDEHMDLIRDDLLDYGYTLVDQIYDPYGTASQVSAALNDGRGILNYCGHGGVYSWSSTGFNTGDVNALVNDNMLPFICSVACVNGRFDGYTCFAETWLRATHNGEPTGAIGVYMSSIDQSWSPPMRAQDEFVDMYRTETYSTLGTLLYAGSCGMMDHYPAGGVSMFNTWHLFGDPSLQVVGPRPPRAYGADLETPPNTPLSIDLEAEDDGLPDPPGALDYVIVALPQHGVLSDPGGGGLIGSVPYTLVGRGNQVIYAPAGGYVGEDGFAFKVNDGGTAPDGGDSGVATILIMVGGPSLVHQFTMDTDPGWSTEGEWAFGVPTGGGSYNGDPTGGYTGDNVYGYNLNGDYSSGMPQYFLTSGPMDFSDATGVELRFWKWLGVESAPFDHANVQVSNNGTDWVTIWDNSGGTVSDSSWSQMTFVISTVADNQPAVYVRWGMGPTDGSPNYPGWNLDDVELWGLVPVLGLPGDFDLDGDVDLSDFAQFANCYGGAAVTTPPGSCTEIEFEECDLDDDVDVDLSDFAVFAANYTGAGS